MTTEFRIPDSHPRAASLRVRERLIEAWREGIVADAGLMAHGRGETFDYLLGEESNEMARKAISAASATLLLARKPVISVNGNAAALCAHELVELSTLVGAELEVNLFYKSRERVARIADLLKSNGASKILGLEGGKPSVLPGIESERRLVDPEGINQADVVLVPLEDGDRTQALRDLRKFVIAIDLNPLSRTARSASICIVDNIVRAMPQLVSDSRNLSTRTKSELQSLVGEFDNKENLRQAVSFLKERLNRLSTTEQFMEAE